MSEKAKRNISILFHLFIFRVGEGKGRRSTVGGETRERKMTSIYVNARFLNGFKHLRELKKCAKTVEKRPSVEFSLIG